MAIHRNSCRVQEAGIHRLVVFFQDNLEFVFTVEHSRAASAVSRCMQTYGYLTAKENMVQEIVATMFLMLEQKQGFVEEFRGLGVIEIVINFLGKCDRDYFTETKCFSILISFPVEDIPFMLSCGIERIILTRMQKSPDDLKVNSDSLSTLHLLYVYGSHSLDSIRDLRPLCIIFEATEKFMHEDEFFQNAMHFFSVLMRDMNLLELHHRFVKMGYVKMISSRMKYIVETPSITPADELLYKILTKILWSISQCDPLYKSVACPDIKVLLEAGMLVFTHNAQVLQVTCDIFRLAFSSPSEIDFPAPALSTAERVLGAMSNNLSELGLTVTCMLTLDRLSICQQVVNFVSQQDGFKKITCLLHNIVAVSRTPVLSHTEQHHFF